MLDKILKGILGVLVIVIILGSFRVVNEDDVRQYYGSYDTEEELKKLKACCSDELAKGWNIERVAEEEMINLFSDGSDNDEMKRYYEENGIIGLTDDVTKTIYLTTEDTYAKMALAHEIGHAVDYNHKLTDGIRPSKTEEFSRIYAEEATGYGELSPEEFFAETYAKLVSQDSYKYDESNKTPMADEYVSQFIY